MRIGLALERDALYERIDRRADRMIEDGLAGEVQRLLDRGYDETLKPMQSLGYKHMIRHLKGDFDLSEALRRLKRDTRHYAKRQMTWFGADREMMWLRPDDTDALNKKVDAFLSSPNGARLST
jgi:tRNA dimethylallyltransferase